MRTTTALVLLAAAAANAQLPNIVRRQTSCSRTLNSTCGPWMVATDCYTCGTGNASLLAAGGCTSYADVRALCDAGVSITTTPAPTSSCHSAVHATCGLWYLNTDCYTCATANIGVLVAGGCTTNAQVAAICDSGVTPVTTTPAPTSSCHSAVHSVCGPWTVATACYTCAAGNINLVAAGCFSNAEVIGICDAGISGPPTPAPTSATHQQCTDAVLDQCYGLLTQRPDCSRCAIENLQALQTQGCTDLASTVTICNDLILEEFNATAVHFVDGTYCLDGSSASYFYFAPPTSASESTRWIIELESTPRCVGFFSCRLERSQVASSRSCNCRPSRYQHQTLSKRLSNNSRVNPYADFHKVVVSSCSGDAHTGTVTTPSTSSFGLYFAGHSNLRHIVAHLDVTYNISNAKDVMLFGVGDAGHGVLVNVDYIQSLLPKAFVRGVTIDAWQYSGFFENQSNVSLPPPYYQSWLASGQTIGTVGPYRSGPSLYAFKNPYTPPACAANHPAWQCELTTVLYPYIEAPLFIEEYAFPDRNLGEAGVFPLTVPAVSSQLTYFSAVGKSVVDTILRLVVNNESGRSKRIPDGVFLPSCHGEPNGRTLGLGMPGRATIQGVRSGEAEASWFLQQNATPIHLVDPVTPFPNNQRCYIDGITIRTLHYYTVSRCISELVADCGTWTTVAQCTSCFTTNAIRLSAVGCADENQTLTLCEAGVLRPMASPTPSPAPHPTFQPTTRTQTPTGQRLGAGGDSDGLSLATLYGLVAAAFVTAIMIVALVIFRRRCGSKTKLSDGGEQKMCVTEFVNPAFSDETSEVAD